MPPSGPQALLTELSKLESLRDPQRCEGLRQYQRFVVRGDAVIQPMDRSRLEQTPQPIVLRDMGRGGLGFVSQQELEFASTWRVTFFYRGYETSPHSIIVRHCRRVQAGVYLVGAQFCADSGLMCVLGIDPAAIRDGDSPVKLANPPAFLSPGEVA